MLYILRLSNAECMILLSPDEQSARLAAIHLDPENGFNVVSVRAIDRLAMQISPTDDGSLEITRWDQDALESILTHEYPVLHEAYKRANTKPFATARPETPVLLHLKTEFERNNEILRAGVREEKLRFKQKGA